MQRRAFITLLGGAAVWPRAARAQQAPVPVIGFLNSQSPEPFAAYVAAFRQGLREAGYHEGQNVAIEYRWAQGRWEDVPALAADLASRRVALIATSGGDPVAQAARAAAPTTPLVFLMGGDPMQTGLVASYSRPGGHATGATQLTLSLGPKRLGLLREMIPNGSTIAVLVNPSFAGTETRMREIEDAARNIGQRLDFVSAASDGEIDGAFAEIGRRRREALLVAGDPFFNSRRARIVELAARHRIPAIYEWRDFVAVGGLMSYGTIISDLYRQIGVYAARVLKGDKPADLPVLQPSRFELVINVKTAKALGLAVPPSMQLLADEVIE
jgi:putative ABC transport system substrate-binding protein